MTAFELANQQLFSKVISQLNNHDGSKSNDSHFRDFSQISKSLSQLIARSWLPGGEAIRDIFNSGNSEEIFGMINKETGINLKEFFGDNVEITIDWGRFMLEIEELYFRKENLWVLKFPYPPRPAQVTDTDLKHWVDNQDSQVTTPPYPYIPLSAGC